MLPGLVRRATFTFDSATGDLIITGEAGLLAASSYIEVDGSRTEDYTENGTLTAPYKTISAAVAAASAGDTIRIARGTYAESVTVAKNINLVGVSYPELQNLSFTHSADCHIAGIKFTGSLSIQPSESDGVSWVDVINCAFADCDVSTYGNLLLDNCRITGLVNIDGHDTYTSNLHNRNTRTESAVVLDVTIPLGLLQIQDCLFQTAAGDSIAFTVTSGQLIVLTTRFGGTVLPTISCDNDATSSAPNIFIGNELQCTITSGDSLTYSLNNVFTGSGSITGTNVIKTQADDVQYDPSTSGLSATQVQEALDELALLGGLKGFIVAFFDPTIDSHYPNADNITSTYFTRPIVTGDTFQATAAGTMAGEAIDKGDVVTAMVDAPDEDNADHWTTPGGPYDHGALLGLEDDDHAQYVNKNGRTGGQTVNGGLLTGTDLTLQDNPVDQNHITVNQIIDGLADGVRYHQDAIIIVEQGATASINGTNLCAAITSAASLTPGGNALSATNRAAVIVPAGVCYRTSQLVLSNNYVDIIGVGECVKSSTFRGTPICTPRSIIVGGAAASDASGFVIKITATDIMVKGLTIQNPWTDATHYYGGVLVDATIDSSAIVLQDIYITGSDDYPDTVIGLDLTDTGYFSCSLSNVMARGVSMRLRHASGYTIDSSIVNSSLELSESVDISLVGAIVKSDISNEYSSSASAAVTLAGSADGCRLKNFAAISGEVKNSEIHVVTELTGRVFNSFVHLTDDTTTLQGLMSGCTACIAAGVLTSGMVLDTTITSFTNLSGDTTVPEGLSLGALSTLIGCCVHNATGSAITVSASSPLISMCHLASDVPNADITASSAKTVILYNTPCPNGISTNVKVTGLLNAPGHVAGTLSSGQPGVPVTWVSSVVDLKSVANTAIATIPADYTFLPDTFEVINVAVTTPGTPPTIKFGTSANRSEFYIGQLTANAAGTRETIISSQVAVVEATVISASVDIASTAASHTGRYVIRGILYRNV